MAVNCTLCGVSMAVAEQNGRRDNPTVGPYHKVCADMDYLYNHADLNSAHSHLKPAVSRARTKLIHKWQGVSDEWP